MSRCGTGRKVKGDEVHIVRVLRKEGKRKAGRCVQTTARGSGSLAASSRGRAAAAPLEEFGCCLIPPGPTVGWWEGRLWSHCLPAIAACLWSSPAGRREPSSPYPTHFSLRFPPLFSVSRISIASPLARKCFLTFSSPFFPLLDFVLFPQSRASHPCLVSFGQ